MMIGTALGTSYRCCVSVERGGGYTVASSGVPSLNAYGETLNAARANAREAIEIWEEETARVHDQFQAVCYNRDL